MADRKAPEEKQKESETKKKEPEEKKKEPEPKKGVEEEEKAAPQKEKPLSPAVRRIVEEEELTPERISATANWNRPGITKRPGRPASGMYCSGCFRYRIHNNRTRSHAVPAKKPSAA